MVAALYDDGCIQAPQTDHVEHALAALGEHGWTLVPSEPKEDWVLVPADWDPHALDDQHPCLVCGSATAHDHSTAEWKAVFDLRPVEDRS